MATAAVIGAGVLGLAVADRLRQRGDEVTVFEASSNVGGLADAWDVGGVTWDRHYHVTLASDARTRQLLRSIDLERELRWVQTRSGFYSGSEAGIRPLSNAFDFLRLPTLTTVEKARLAATILAGARRRDRERMEQVSAREWLITWSGRHVFERFWLPLLRAKLGETWQEASAALVWATIQRLYAARHNSLKAEQQGYVPGGYARIFDRYAASLNDAGVKINPNAPVRRIREARAGLEVHLDDASATFDRVVVTTAAHLAAGLCPDLTDAEQRRLRAVRYVGVVCASVLLARRLSPFCTTYLTDPAAPFTLVVELTSFVEPTEVGGWNLVYLPKYVPAADPLLAADDRDVRQSFLPYLLRMHPHVDLTDVGAFKVSRVKHVFPVPTLGYSQSMPSTTTSIPGLQLISSANLPFATVNVNDTLSLLRELR